MSKIEKPILEVNGLTKHYVSKGSMVDNILGRTQLVKAVEDVNIELHEGETLGIVGESGCGKTTLGRAILRLIEPTSGSVVYRKRNGDGTIEEIELTDLSSSAMRDLRKDLQYIFQDPFSSLNPRMTVGDIVGEPLKIHGLPASDPSVVTRANLTTDGVNQSNVTVNVADDIDLVVDPEDGVAEVDVTVRRETADEPLAESQRRITQTEDVVVEVAQDLTVSASGDADDLTVTVTVGRKRAELRLQRVQELLEVVGLSASHAFRYPHEFSGGQRQRIGIARALAVDPEIIVCDEPVSALDVSVQAQILNLLEDLQEEFDLSYIFIAHDLSVVEHISDRVAVMYLGEVAEIGRGEDIFANPKHPYTEALLSVIPEPDPQWTGEKILLEGQVPSALNPPEGCRFHTRCHRVIPPDEYDLDQSTWRSLLTLKLAIRDTASLQGVVTTGPAGELEPQLEKAPVSKVDEVVRGAYELPDSLLDPTADARLTEIMEPVAAGDMDAAFEQFDEYFTSPCETVNPRLLPVDGRQEVACLLYDDSYRDDEYVMPADEAIADD